MEGSPRRVFLSHTSELRKFPENRSFVEMAEAAVNRAGDAVADMKYFAARDEKPADYCQATVHGCDIYAGLIGLRYGSPVRDRPDVSYTELEFDAATEAGKTRLIFMLDEKAALPIPADELHDEDPDLRARQQAFRKRLGEAGLIVRRFSSPEQLETELLHALKDTQEKAADGGTAETWELRGHRPDPYFTGRDDELEALHQAFRAKSAASAVQVISGLGGLGKTRLAVEYAWRYASDYDLVWWIRAEDSATMRGDYAELAGKLGLPSEQDDQAIAALRQELRRRKDWLLVFDNAEEPAELFSLLPERHQGHVLITSRRRDWPHTEDRRLEVLSIEAATGYLQRRGRVADAGTARDLAEALGCLPLALAQAGSVIAEGMAATDYLALLRQQAPELFTEGHPADHETTIGSTWRVSVDRLAERSPAAVALFRLAAFLGADAIPLSRLAPAPDMPAELAEALGSPFQRTKAMAALGEYSLAETADGLLSIHRMVQAVTRSELGPDKSRWAGLALGAIAAAFPGDVRDPETWGACESLLAHALACTEHAGRLHVDTPVTVSLLDRVARYLLVRGRIDATAAVMDQARPLAKQLGSEDAAYLSCRNTDGLLHIARGDYPAAHAACDEVFQARTKILGATDPETLRAGRDLVEAIYHQGNWAEAAELQDRLVEAFTATFGPENAETITALAYHATILRRMGHFAQARTKEERVLETRSQVLGPDHPDTTLAWFNLADTLRSLGQLDQARTMEEQVLQASTRLLGPDHPSTLTATGNLAITLRQLGQLDQARTLEEQVLQARTRLLGPDHPDTLTATANLASTLHGLGQLDQARTMEEQVLQARTRLLGPDHPSTLTVTGNLAITLRQLGQLDQARTLEEQALQASTRLLGPDHPDTLTATANLASTLRGLGQLDQARTLEEQVLQASTRLLGPGHPVTLTVTGNLAITLRQLGQLDQARTLQGQVLQARRQVQGQDHSDTIYAMVDLARTLYAQDNKKDARSLLAEALTISLRSLGKNHTVTTNVAWQMVQDFEPHEASRRNAFVMQNLSWLSSASPNQLTGEQKGIKNGLKRFLHGGRPKNRKKKK
jgi:tetratricopeptide (TPR) repeat protein